MELDGIQTDLDEKFTENAKKIEEICTTEYMCTIYGSRR